MDQVILWSLILGLVLATSVPLLLRGKTGQETGLEVTQVNVLVRHENLTDIF